MTQSAILAEISIGELIDKITILEIKGERIADPAKLANIRTELAALQTTRARALSETDRLAALERDLKAVNAKIWQIEDDIRECERQKDFGEAFVALARSVYRTNDERARLKREINDLMGSAIVEEKSYAAY